MVWLGRRAFAKAREDDGLTDRAKLRPVVAGRPIRLPLFNSTRQLDPDVPVLRIPVCARLLPIESPSEPLSAIGFTRDNSAISLHQ